MSFGKRGAQPPGRPSNRPAAPQEPPQSPLRGQLGRLALGVAIGLALVLGAQFLLMPMVGKSITQRFEQHPAETALAKTYPSTSAALIAACPAPAFGIEMPMRGGTR